MRIGWCPGGRAVADMLALYPGTQVARIFVGPGKPLPAWDGPVPAPLVAADATVHLSFKTNPVADVVAWVARKPAGVLLILTFAHEPEQQRDGDPTPEVFHARWGQLVDALAGHPQRPEILLAPVYTRYWWQANAGDLRWLLTVPVDAIGWDVYNNGVSYRSPDDLLSIPRDIAKRTGLPYLLPELGAVRVPGDDTGAGRQAWMRSMVDAASSDGALTACWFHKDEWELTADLGAQHTWQAITLEASVQPYLAPSLTTLRAEINARWPRRDKTSDGWIGDRAHQATRSDHNPNARGSVNAADFDEDGINVAEVIDAFERHPSAHYWIYEGQIADRDDGWRRRPYAGSNPHDKHVHVSIRQTRQAEQDTRPWGLTKEDDIVATLDEMKTAMRQVLDAQVPFRSDGIAKANPDRPRGVSDRALAEYAWHDGGRALAELAALRSAVRTLGEVIARESASPDEVRALLAEMPAPPAADEIAAGVLAGLDPAAIAAAIPTDIAGQVADELAARLGQARE